MRELSYMFMLLFVCLFLNVNAQKKVDCKSQDVDGFKSSSKTIGEENKFKKNSTQNQLDENFIPNINASVISYPDAKSEAKWPENEVVEKRDRYSKTFANPDGSFSKMQSSAPMHYKDKNGNWLTYNANLVKEKNKDGIFVLKGTDLDISVDVFSGIDRLQNYNLKCNKHLFMGKYIIKFGTFIILCCAVLNVLAKEKLNEK